MNSQNTINRFQLVLTVGDESGIGPEILLKALNSNEIPKNINYIIFGSRKNLQKTYRHLKTLGVENLANPKNLNIYDLEISSSYNSKSDYGNSSFYYLTKAIELVKQYPNSALVTGQFAKSWSLAGHYFSGQTEVLAKLWSKKCWNAIHSKITNYRLEVQYFTSDDPYNFVKFPDN